MKMETNEKLLKGNTALKNLQNVEIDKINETSKWKKTFCPKLFKDDQCAVNLVVS